jgi:hypothetical protein
VGVDNFWEKYEMNEWWEKVKEHPIYSKVIAGLILAALLAISNQVFSWNIFSSIFSFASQKYIVPVWGLVVIGISPIVFIVGIVCFIVFIKKDPASQNNKEQFELQSLSVWMSYVEDIIFTVLWQWKYFSDGSINTRSLLPLCPKCKRQLKTQESYISFRGAGIYMNCFNCDFKTDFIGGDYYNFSILVIREIEGRIRSGEYKDKIKKAI